MKALIVLIISFTSLISCTENKVNNSQLIGKWNHTYQIKEKNADGTWGKWHTINTFVAMPVLEFTTDNKILWNGKPAQGCCQFLKYLIKNNEIILTDNASGVGCELVDCANCTSWQPTTLTESSLEIQMCSVMHKYEKQK
jgi:hypothetical protein